MTREQRAAWTQSLAGILGLFILAAAISGSVSSFPHELTITQAWWLVMAALGAFVVAGTYGGRWRDSGIVAASMLGGFSAQLALTQPRWFPSIEIQPDTPFDVLLVAMIGIEAAVVVWALVKRVSIDDGVRFITSLGAVSVVLIAALSVLISVSVMSFVGTRDVASYVKQLVLAGGLGVLHLGAVFALATSIPARPLRTIQETVSGWVSLPGTLPERRPLDRLLPRLVAVWVLVACSLLAVCAFERLPHLEDEVTYLFQAKTLLQGRVSVPAPPPAAREALEVYLLDVKGDEWFAVTAPGWPFVLAAGVAVGLPWLINPFLAALAILLAHVVLREVADRGTANLTILLMGSSPWFLETSSTMMLHTLALVALLVAWAALLKARAGRAPPPLALVAGASMGLLFVTRPYEGVIFGVLTGLWTLRLLIRKRGWTIVFGYALGCIAVGQLLLVFNARFTGSYSTTPINAYLEEHWHPGANRLGFGPDIGPRPSWGAIDIHPGHSIQEALVHIQHSLQGLNVELFAWSCGSLIMVLAFLFWGRLCRLDVWMLLVFGLTVLAYSLYWFSGSFFIGPRYWFMALLPLVVVTARGTAVVAGRLRAASDSSAAARLGAVMVVLTAIALSSFVTWRASTRFRGYQGYHRGYIELARRHDLRNGLVFVKTRLNSDYQSAFILNPLDLVGSSAPVFVRDLGPEKNEVTAAAFSERRLFYVDGPFGETEDLRISRGPLARETLP